MLIHFRKNKGRFTSNEKYLFTLYEPIPTLCKWRIFLPYFEYCTCQFIFLCHSSVRVCSFEASHHVSTVVHVPATCLTV